MKYLAIIFVTLICLGTVNAICSVGTILEKDFFYFPRNPKIYSNFIIYEDYSNIQGYDLGYDLMFNTTDDLGFFNITDNGLLNIDPDIYNHSVTWIIFNQSSEIYRCDLSKNGGYG